MEELREWVERYHAWGWSMFPLKSGEVKTPAIKWKAYQERQAKLTTCLKWVEQGYNLAVIFGSTSGELGARDFDDHASYESWVESYPQLARQLPTMRTKRGCQVFFRLQPGDEQRFRASINDREGTGAKKCLAGELRIGKGCYSKIPPAYITQDGSLE